MIRKPISIFMRAIVALLLIWALAPHSYGYYTLLRWVVFGVGLYCIHLAMYPTWSETDNGGWAFAFIPSTYLFNPIFPRHFSKDVWGIIDITCAVFFVVSIFFFRESIVFISETDKETINYEENQND